MEEIVGDLLSEELVSGLGNRIQRSGVSPIDEEGGTALVVIPAVEQNNSVRDSEQPCSRRDGKSVLVMRGWADFKIELFGGEFESRADGFLVGWDTRQRGGAEEEAVCSLSGSLGDFVTEYNRASVGLHGNEQVVLGIDQLCRRKTMVAGAGGAIGSGERDSGELDDTDSRFQLRVAEVRGIQYAAGGGGGPFASGFETVTRRVEGDLRRL